MTRHHLSRRLTIAASTALAVGAVAAPAMAAAGPHATPAPNPTPNLKRMDSTPLGRAIVKEDDLTRIDAPLSRANLKRFIADRAAIEKGETVVRAVAAEGARQIEAKRVWLHGEQVLALSDREFIVCIRQNGEDQTNNHARIAGLNDSNYGDGLTGWAYNALADPGNPGRVPTR